MKIIGKFTPIKRTRENILEISLRASENKLFFIEGNESLSVS
jgi:hypothetical protein